MPFGMYIGKDMMESAAEGEAYRRASHPLKHERGDKEILTESDDIYILHNIYYGYVSNHGHNLNHLVAAHPRHPSLLTHV